MPSLLFVNVVPTHAASNAVRARYSRLRFTPTSAALGCGGDRRGDERGCERAGSPALVRTSFVRSNAVGIHVQDAALREEADATEISPGEVIVTADTTFADNATKVGSGVLALPEPPTAKEP